MNEIKIMCKEFVLSLIAVSFLMIVIVLMMIYSKMNESMEGFVVEIESEPVEQIKAKYVTVSQVESYRMTTHKYHTAVQNEFRIECSSEELNALESLVEHEAGGENYLCRLLVASVIVNRVLDDNFPDTLMEVIHDNKPVLQFTPSTNLYKEPSEGTKEAVQEALKKDYADGAWIFNNKDLTSPDKQAWFEEFEIVAEVGNVQFRK